MKITIETNFEKVVIETNKEEIDVMRTPLTSCCSKGHEGTPGPQGVHSEDYSSEDEASEYGGV